jgi:uncharacterized protein YcfJ
MNKSLVIGVATGAIAVTAVGALATREHLGFGPRYAEVISVKAITKTVSTPRQACHEEQVTRQKPVKDEHRVAGTVIGAVVGGILGNQIGGGSGKALATAAGVMGGGYAGNRIENKMQKADTETVSETRCATVYDRTEIPAGYRVTYRLNGKTEVLHMDHDPGARIPLRDGKLVLDDPGKGAS